MNLITFFIIFIPIIIIAIIMVKFSNKPYVIWSAIGIAMVFVASAFYIMSTESGKRFVKDVTSDVSGGIPRHVKVYDIDGEIIEEYKGTFDIETNNDNYILFDDENNLRHIIYFTTGTIIIDELEE